MLVDLPKLDRTNDSVETIRHILSLIELTGEPEIIQTGVVRNYHWNPDIHFDFTGVERHGWGPFFDADTIHFAVANGGSLKPSERIQLMKIDTSKLAGFHHFPTAWQYDSRWPRKPSHMASYGVCDSPEQLLSLYDFEADPRKFWISMVEIRKADQPDKGGWRWHKWGEYFGNHNPQHEYLYNEPDIESVWTFHVYEILDNPSLI